MSETSLRISSARIFDGKSSSFFAGHVFFSNGRITRIIREPTDAKAQEHVDATPSLLEISTDAILAPGFVDLHSHSDLSLLAEPSAVSKVAQGITTEVVGNCGFSPFPEPSYWLEDRTKYRLSNDGWSTAEEYFTVLGQRRIASNVASLVGLGGVRARAMGTTDRGRPTAKAMHQMVEDAVQAVESGAIGVSSGLFYFPGSFATPDEVATIVREVRLATGVAIYATHLRDESADLVESVREAIQIASSAEVRLHISHLKAKGKPNWGAVEKALDLIEVAAIPTTFDVYPYTVSMTRLDTLIPSSLLSHTQRGGSASDASSVVEAVEDSAAERDGPDVWNRVVFSHVPGRPELNGKSITTACEMLGVRPGELVLKLSETDFPSDIQWSCMSKEDVDLLLDHSQSVVATDGYALPLHAFGAAPHPRSFGAFPRFLHRATTSQLPTALSKVSSLPAAIAGLADVGEIAVNRRADFVVLNPETISDRATYSRPTILPDGVDHILVGGEVIVQNDGAIANPNGELLRRETG